MKPRIDAPWQTSQYFTLAFTACGETVSAPAARAGPAADKTSSRIAAGKANRAPLPIGRRYRWPFGVRGIVFATLQFSRCADLPVNIVTPIRYIANQA